MVFKYSMVRTTMPSPEKTDQRLARMRILVAKDNATNRERAKPGEMTCGNVQGNSFRLVMCPNSVASRSLVQIKLHLNSTDDQSAFPSFARSPMLQTDKFAFIYGYRRCRMRGTHRGQL